MSTIRDTLIYLFMLCVRLIVQSYTLITLPLYYIIQNPSKELRLSRVRRSRQLNPMDPYSPWVRTGTTPQHILMTCRTLYDCFEQMKKLYPPDRPVVGFRNIIEEQVVYDSQGDVVRVDGKVLRKFRLTDYQWMSYEEVFTKCQLISKGLLLNGFKRNDKCVVLCETCAENLLFMISTQSIGVISVGVFANLGDEGIIHAINETESQHVFTSYDLLPKLLSLLYRCSTITTVIYIESKMPLNTNSDNNNYDLPQNIRIIPLSQVAIDGLNAPDQLEINGFINDEVAVIGYTSGTTGVPKGVCVTLAQIRESALAVLPAVEKFMSAPERQIYVAYLPQAHVLEASIELISFIGGARIGFATPFTLNESAPGLAADQICDLKLLEPTVMTCVPLVLDRMRKEMYLKLSKRTPVSTDLFNFLIDYKTFWTKKGYDCPIVNTLLCSKVREQFGGKLEQLIVGAAPLAPQLQALIKAALNVTLVQGYGATETTGAVMCMDDKDLSYGRCGAPLAGIELRLEDWPEGGYTAVDEPNPRGELIIGGFSVSNGYYNNPELTAQSFIMDANGMNWFRSGDICEVFPNGSFKIIDRKKDLIKLSNGEYFSLGKIEACLINCSFVDNICVFGNDLYLIALIVPNINAMEKLAKDLKIIDLLNTQSFYLFPIVIERVHKAIIDTALEHNLNRREIPLKISICCEEWTPDNRLLTAAMKLKRHNIQIKYKLLIDRMFALQ